MCDFERWSASRDASKAAASAVEEEQAAKVDRMAVDPFSDFEERFLAQAKS